MPSFQLFYSARDYKSLFETHYGEPDWWPEGVTVTTLDASNEGYESALRQAFNFFRLNDDGRYSSAMKMRVLATAEMAAEISEKEGEWVNSPGVITVSKPFTYDEDTEVKTGGVVAVLIFWPEQNGRVMLAVKPEYRRRKMASYIMFLLRACICVPEMEAWVNKRNKAGQAFLLNNDFELGTINSSGGVCFTWGNRTEEGQEDGVDPDAPVRRRRQPVAVPLAAYDEDEHYPDDPEF